MPVTLRRSAGDVLFSFYFYTLFIMWIVRLALRRPYTVAVMAFLIMILGIMSIKSMMVDIFPVIDIPVVNVIWNYTGLSAADMERMVRRNSMPDESQS